MQAVAIALKTCISAISTYQDIRIDKDTIWVENRCSVGHSSEGEMWKLFLLFFRKGSHPTCSPNANKLIDELFAGQAVLLQKKFYHTSTFLLYQLVFFAHTEFNLCSTRAKIQKINDTGLTEYKKNKISVLFTSAFSFYTLVRTRGRG